MRSCAFAVLAFSLRLWPGTDEHVRTVAHHAAPPIPGQSPGLEDFVARLRGLIRCLRAHDITEDHSRHAIRFAVIQINLCRPFRGDFAP
jgi:hypothetical protein